MICRYVGEHSLPISSELQGVRTHVVSTTPATPEPEIRSRKEFIELEDRPIVREQVTRLMEHRPVEKQYETTLK